MEPVSTFLSLALGYILQGASQSKTAETAKDEMLGAFWQWVRPLFLKDVPEAEEQPDTEATESKMNETLLELIKDEKFFDELVKRVNALQKAGVKEKNIVHKDIKGVKKIRIGDKEYNPDETFDRKNIVEGNIENAEEFTLGDGH